MRIKELKIKIENYTIMEMELESILLPGVDPQRPIIISNVQCRNRRTSNGRSPSAGIKRR